MADNGPDPQLAIVRRNRFAGGKVITMTRDNSSLLRPH